MLLIININMLLIHDLMTLVEGGRNQEVVPHYLVLVQTLPGPPCVYSSAYLDLKVKELLKLRTR